MKKISSALVVCILFASHLSFAAAAKRSPLEFKIHHKTVLSVNAVENVQMQTQPEEKNWAITFKLNDSDAKAFEKITENNINEDLEIFLDGKLEISPKIRVAIHDGRLMVTSPTEKKANLIYHKLLKAHP